ncbi:MAG: hypothetical protein H0U50_05500, partial [Pyrinomonadaceae bacterium]|nr:hypothetical protein [Pyrinomonadaceae bacterium]
IEPDLKAPALAYNALRYRINEAAFYFVRQLAAGKVQGFENNKVEKQNYNTTIQPNDLQINDKLFETFRNQAVSIKENGLTAENINSQIDYAKSRLREELATANYSNEAGIQVLLESDPQVLKAVEAIPEAKKFLEKNLANKAGQ